MAFGVDRCFYCEDSAGTTIDHWRPIVLSLDGTYYWPNHILSCGTCNSRYKVDKFPTDPTGAPLLLDPTTEDPLDHLAYSPLTGMWVPTSLRGEATIEVLALNREELQERRRYEWNSLRGRLEDLGRRSPAKDLPQVAQACADVGLTRERLLSAVFLWLLRTVSDVQPAVLQMTLGPYALEAAHYYRDELLAVEAA